MSFYIVGGVKLNSTLIPYSNVSIAPELQKVLMNSDARAGQSFTGVNTAGPMIRITTPALAAVLDITGLAGAVLTAFEVYLIKHDAAAVASGSAHRKWTMTAGLARIESITTSNGVAELVVEVHGVYDGTNAVWVLTDSVAIPTQDTVSDVWYQGPLYIGTTEYKVEQSSFNPGAEIIKRHSNGHVGPNFVGLRPIKPTLSVQSADGIMHGASGAFGANVADVLMYYRKGAEGSGLRVSDATETHISLTIPSAFMTPENVDGSPGQEVGFGVMFDLRDDGSNAVITLDTTAAIEAPV